MGHNNQDFELIKCKLFFDSFIEAIAINSSNKSTLANLPIGRNFAGFVKAPLPVEDK